jgi:hypothetical protein
VIVEFGTGNTRPVYENGCRFDITPMLDGKGEQYAQTLKISIDIRLKQTEPASLDTQIADLETFWSGTQSSFRLLYDDGTTPTAHAWAASDTIGGFRVTKPPSYLKYENGEHVSYRTSAVELEAVLKLTDNPFQIIEFTESIDYEGGGPVYGHLQPNEGFAVKQRLRTNDLWRATQSGRVVYLGDYGSIPAPIWPSAVVGRPKLRGESPRRIGNSYMAFPTSYTYSFESSTPLSGRPNIWT